MNLAIFDIDGTLTSSHGYDVHFFAALARRIDIDEADSGIRHWTDVTDEGIAYESFTRQGRVATASDIDGIKADYGVALRAHLREVPPMPGARGVLSDLRAQPDWRIAIATGNWTFAGELKLAAGGIDSTGIPVVGCDGRPSREELMTHALELSQAAHGTFERVVYVGDAPWDVQATRRLGWNFLGFNADRRKLLDLGATQVLTDYSDLEATRAALLAADVPR